MGDSYWKLSNAMTCRRLPNWIPIVTLHFYMTVTVSILETSSITFWLIHYIIHNYINISISRTKNTRISSCISMAQCKNPSIERWSQAMLVDMKNSQRLCDRIGAELRPEIRCLGLLSPYKILTVFCSGNHHCYTAWGTKPQKNCQ